MCRRARSRRCVEDGLDVVDELTRTGIFRGALTSPSGRVRASSARALWGWTHVHLPRADTSLRVAQAVTFGAYQLVDFLVSSAPKLDVALRSLARAPEHQPLDRRDRM